MYGKAFGVFRYRRSVPQGIPMGAEKLLLLPAEWPDQIRPFNAPAAQGFPGERWADQPR